MTAFELSFALISLLLGLGFAHVAGAFANLVIAGPKVRWDWLSPLAALLTFQSGLIYWWYQWSLRGRDVVLAELTVRALACLALYVMAVAVFPDPKGGKIDLREHFERSRRLIYGSLATYVLIVGVLLPGWRMITGQSAWDVPWMNVANIGLMVIGFFFANRLFHTVFLTYMVAALGLNWMAQAIA